MPAVVLAALLTAGAAGAGVLGGPGAAATRLAPARRAARATTAASSVALASPVAPACSRPSASGAELTQAPDGAVHGCWLVGAHAAGAYHVALSGYLGPFLGGAATGAPVAVSLSRTVGRPGSVVVVHGRLLVPELARTAPTTADVCFDGCDGLVEDAVSLHWLHGGGTRPSGAVPTGDVASFTARADVPDAPWFVAGRPHSLVSGSYPIGVACVGAEGPALAGCGLHPAQGSAPFHLVVARPTLCTPARPCARLQLSPPAAKPGTAVRVSGIAPVSAIVGQPFGYTLAVGPTLAAASSVPPRTGGALRLALTTFRVVAPDPWSALPSTKPLLAQQSGPEPGPTSLDASDPGLVAACAPGAVRLVSAATGAVVRTLPTRAVDDVHLGGGVSLWPPPAGSAAIASAGAAGASSGSASPARSCVDVLVGPGQSGAVFAAFGAAGPQGAPPVEQVGVVTTDGGATWHAVPAPAGSNIGLLSGFAVTPSGAVDALFQPSAQVRPSGQPSHAPELVEASTDGGARWRSARLACPAVGPCTTLGAFAPGNCAMNGTVQDLLVSADSGRTFVAAGTSWPGPLDACGPGEVAATSSRDALVVDSDSPFLLLSTSDGGRSFDDVGLPALHLAEANGTLGQGGSFPAGSGGLVLLPDGSLLQTTGALPPLVVGPGAEPSRSAPWHLLRAGASGWCSVGPLAVRGSPASHGQGGSGAGTSVPVSAVAALAGRLWWSPLQADSSSPTGQLESVALSAVGCG